MTRNRLIAMSGLPGSGKSSVAEGLARHLNAPIFSVDPVEAAMWTSGLHKEDTGIAAYKVVWALAAENLQLGMSAIIDAVNPVQAARDMWRQLASEHNVPLLFIEVECSDEAIHQNRIESRVRGITGMSEVSWGRVQARKREYETWSEERLLLDSAYLSPETLVDRVIEHITRT